MSRPDLAATIAVAAFAVLASRPAPAQAVDPHAGHAAPSVHAAAGMPGIGHPPRVGTTLRLTSSRPIAQSPVQGSPDEVVMTFDHAMTFESVMLTNAVGQQIPTRSTLPTEPVDSLRFPVVIPLQPGAYKIAWRAAEPSPPAHGVFSFHVTSADGRVPQPLLMSQHHH